MAHVESRLEEVEARERAGHGWAWSGSHPPTLCARSPSGIYRLWFDRLADDPSMFADLAGAGEAVLPEEFYGRAEQESSLGFAACRHLGMASTSPPPSLAI